MQIFGWLLFFVGGVFLFLSGFVGVSGIANLPGVILGMALLVSGSVFAAAGYMVEELKSPAQTVKSHAPEETADRREQVATTSSSDKISLPPDFNRLVKERKEKNPFGATVTIYEFDEGSFVIENSNGQWERYDTLEEAKSNAS